MELNRKLENISVIPDRKSYLFSADNAVHRIFSGNSREDAVSCFEKEYIHAAIRYIYMIGREEGLCALTDGKEFSWGKLFETKKWWMEKEGT